MASSCSENKSPCEVTQDATADSTKRFRPSEPNRRARRGLSIHQNPQDFPRFWRQICAVIWSGYGVRCK